RGLPDAARGGRLSLQRVRNAYDGDTASPDRAESTAWRLAFRGGSRGRRGYGAPGVEIFRRGRRPDGDARARTQPGHGYGSRVGAEQAPAGPVRRAERIRPQALWFFHAGITHLDREHLPGVSR